MGKAAAAPLNIDRRVYRFIAEFYRRPMVVAGFEPLDILQSIWMVLKQIKEGRAYTILPHRSDPVSENQPASLGFNR